ncbi:MAG TPA: zf-TFIIB domain-containing protein [Bryobacteraceae bacterium]|nr:zf-TFIIB domain-containing protein [Bryobacteraceae bacterium]
MPIKPTQNEEEYFARQEAERKRKLAAERESRIAAEERERQRELHHMRCPKCGSQLEEITYGNIHIDKCFSCEGVWLDKGEIDEIGKKDAGFMGKLLGGFRS